MDDVRVFRDGVEVRANGTGQFAAVVRDRLPDWPLATDAQLQDRAAREHFLIRALGLARRQALFAGRWTTGDLVRFHAGEKLLLLAHHPIAYHELGRLVAAATRLDRDALAAAYSRMHAAALARPATVGRHVNTLQHALGYFRGRSRIAARQALDQRLEGFRRGETPLAEMLQAVLAEAKTVSIAYLAGQAYLALHPSLPPAADGV